MNSQGTSFSELNICTCFTSLYFRTLLPPRRRPRSCFLFLWGLKGQRALAEGEKKERRGEREPEIYDCVDLPLWGWSLWIHLDFVLWCCCPVCAIGYSCMQRHRETCLPICCYMDHPGRQMGEEGDRKGCWGTDQWPAGLDYCPGAMVTGTNQYYISMTALYGYNYLCDCLSRSLSVSLLHLHIHTHMGF